MSRRLLPAPTLVHTRQGRAVLLGLAIITMATEMGALLIDRTVHIGTLPLSASIVPSLVLLLALGSRGVGRVGERDRLVPFWIAMAAGLLLGYILFSRTGNTSELVGLVVAATNEEVVYRFAVPVVLATALMVLKVPAGAARVTGYLLAGGWWVLLPGHQVQTDSAANLATYVAFAIISALVVARSRALIPMSIAHCVLNVITFSHMRGDISSVGRGVLSASLLFLLVGTFAWPGATAAAQRLRSAGGTPIEEPPDLVGDTVIDLREGQRPAVHHGDEVTWLDDAEPAAVPPEPDRAPRPG